MIVHRLLLVVLACTALFTLTAAQTNDSTPIQQRIALQPNGMTVSWSTVGPIDAVPSVAYWTNSSKQQMSATGVTHHYVPSISWFHHVVLNGLSPSTTYYWQVTSPADVNSTVLSFTTAPKVGSHMPFTVSINGDMGLVNEDNTVATMKEWVDRIDLFWHVGDLAYADDWHELKMTYETVMETWMTRMTDIWNQRPYMMCPGNHEATCDEGRPNICPDGQRNFTSYRERFRMPAVESGAVNNMWHSFDYGLVHFISIDTEASYPGAPEGPGTPMNGGPFGDQLGWLEADLKKAVANRANVPWILVSGHRPYYSSGGVEIHSRPAFEPLFVKYNVDIVYWGHVHWYDKHAPHCRRTLLLLLLSSPAVSHMTLCNYCVAWTQVRAHVSTILQRHRHTDRLHRRYLSHLHTVRIGRQRRRPNTMAEKSRELYSLPGYNPFRFWFVICSECNTFGLEFL